MTAVRLGRNRVSKPAVAEWDDCEFFDWDAEKARREANPKLVPGQDVSFWTEDRIDLLKRLWAQDLYASDIAKAIGSGCTRNAVIGKANRLNLAARKRSDFTRVVKYSKGRKLKSTDKGKGTHRHERTTQENRG